MTGASGQVGGELLTTLASLGEIIAPNRSEMDLADVDAVRRTIREVAPRWIVNPGAYTAVDRAESESELAYAVNEHAVRTMGEEAQKIGAGVIHFSTDYVFDGTGITPYNEDDPTGPVSVYGASKLAGEKALAVTGAAHMIFRTSWVYGTTGKNFVRTILKLAREKDKLRIVADQYGAPTWSRDLARMIRHVLDIVEAETAGRTPGEAMASYSGVYHAPGAGETTWYGFAAEAVRLSQQREPGTKFAELEPIPSTEFPTPAKRPTNSRMNAAKLSNHFHWHMMNWKTSLAEVIQSL